MYLLHLLVRELPDRLRRGEEVTVDADGVGRAREGPDEDGQVGWGVDLLTHAHHALIAAAALTHLRERQKKRERENVQYSAE